MRGEKWGGGSKGIRGRLGEEGESWGGGGGERTRARGRARVVGDAVNPDGTRAGGGGGGRETATACSAARRDTTTQTHTRNAVARAVTEGGARRVTPLKARALASRPDGPIKHRLRRRGARSPPHLPHSCVSWPRVATGGRWT